MSSQKRKKNKTPLEHAFGEQAKFIAIPAKFISSKCFQTLPYSAQALYIALCSQYRPATTQRYGNNGDLTLGRYYMEKHHGFNTPRTLQNAKNSLLERKIILVSRKPLRTREPILYALSTHTIDFVDDGQGQCKHDLKPTNKPPDTWVEWEDKN